MRTWTEISSTDDLVAPLGEPGERARGMTIDELEEYYGPAYGKGRDG